MKLNNKNDVKLYNMILPPFMIFMFSPLLWLISLGGNFIIDSLVMLTVILIICKKLDFNVYKKTILRVWLLGFFADFLGLLYLFTVTMSFSNYYNYNGTGLFYEICNGANDALNHSHFDSTWGVIIVASGILVSAIFIFLLDYFFAFRQTKFTKKQRLISALSFAILTAPYTFLLPKEIFY